MEITIEITDYCLNECSYCSTNAKSVRENILGFSEIQNFLDNVSAPIDRINISGGEPLSHPDFWNILQLCETYTKNVWVYTNALRQIMYNTDIIKELKVEANVCLMPGKEAYIPENVDKVHLLQLVAQGRAKDMKPANFHVSSNITMANNCDHDCDSCKHTLLQADRKVVEAPCKKEY